MAQAKPDRVEYITRLKFGSVLQYTVDDHGMEDVNGPNYFHSIAQRYINPGDEISVAVITRGKIEKPLAWAKARFEVISTSPTETIVEQITDWVESTSEQPAEVEQPVEAAQPKKTLTLKDKAA